jgi:hypothetical protein
MERMPFPRAAEAVALRFGVSLEVKTDTLTSQQSRRALEQAEFCKWWWDRWSGDTLAEMYAALERDDEEFAGCISRVRLHQHNMSPMERYKFFERSATAADREDWREHQRYEREFSDAWMGLAKGII